MDIRRIDPAAARSALSVIGLSLQQISNQLSKPVGAVSVDRDFGRSGQGGGGLAIQPAKQRLAFSLLTSPLSCCPPTPAPRP